MDIYLPADFRELHDAAPDDWRDGSSSCPPYREDAPRRSPPGPDASDPDPLWRVL